MNRHMMIAAFAAISAASITAAPTVAQDQSPQKAKKATESAPASSATIMPAPTPRLGTRRSTSSDEGPQLQSEKATRPLTLSPGGAPNLPVR